MLFIWYLSISSLPIYLIMQQLYSIYLSFICLSILYFNYKVYIIYSLLIFYHLFTPISHLCHQIGRNIRPKPYWRRVRDKASYIKTESVGGNLIPYIYPLYIAGSIYWSTALSWLQHLLLLWNIPPFMNFHIRWCRGNFQWTRFFSIYLSIHHYWFIHLLTEVAKIYRLEAKDLFFNAIR